MKRSKQVDLSKYTGVQIKKPTGTQSRGLKSLKRLLSQQIPEPDPDPELGRQLMDQLGHAFTRERVAIYVRCACGSENDPALQRQLDQIKAYFPNACFERVPVFADSGVGGLAGPKPALNDLCDEVRERKYDYVLAADLARYSRDLEESLKLEAFGLEYGCSFLALSDCKAPDST